VRVPRSEIVDCGSYGSFDCARDDSVMQGKGECGYD
jgi:hypothetical protein